MKLMWNFNAKQWKRRLFSLCLAVCLIVQAVLTNIVLPAQAADGGNFSFKNVTINNKNGVAIKNGDTVSMSEPIYIRYEFEILNAGEPGESLDIQLPKEIGVYDDMTFKLVSEDDAIKFATVTITKDGKGKILLLEASKYLKGLEGWFELETFWNAKEVGLDENNDVSLEFPIGTAETPAFDLIVKRPDIDASMQITKNGKAEDDGSITWTVTITPDTKPIPFPINNVEIVDIIDDDQTYVPGSGKVIAASGEEKTMRASFGFQNVIPEKMTRNTYFAASESDATPSDATSSNTSKASDTAAFTLPVSYVVEQAAAKETGYEVTYAEADRKLTCKFTDAVGEPYTFTYSTRPNAAKMRDDQFVKGDRAKYIFENSATVIFPVNGIDLDPVMPGKKTADGTVEYPLNYIEKNGQIFDADSQILWTVSVNKSHMNVEDACIKDVLQSEFLALDTDQVFYNKEKLVLCDQSDTDGRCLHNDPLHYTYGKNTRTLLYYLGNLDEKEGELTYYTTIDPEKYGGGDESSFNIQNEAWLGGNGGWYGKGPTVLEPLRGYIKKEGAGYNASNHQITWHVTVNETGRELKNVVLTDVLSLDKDTNENAQKYVSGSFKILSGGSYDEANLSVKNNEDETAQTLQYTLGNINKSYLIEFKTELLREEDYQTNNFPAGGYRNTAELKGNYQERPFDGISTGKQNITSTVLKKTGTYDHASNIIDWVVTVNSNEMPVTGAFLTDTLPNDQTFYIPDGKDINAAVRIEGTDAYTVEYDADTAPNTLTVRFTGTGNEQTINNEYKVHITTQLTKEFMENFEKINGILTVENNAEFGGTNIKPSNVTGQVDIDNQIVGKKASYENGDSAITWRILLNQHRSAVAAAGEVLTDIYLTDELAAGLSLDLDSVKLYKNVVINSDGSYGIDDAGKVIYDELGGEMWSTISKDSPLTFGQDDGNIRYQNAVSADGKSIFEFHITPDPVGMKSTKDDIFGGSNYVLEFKTDIAASMADKPLTITNTASLTGIGVDKNDSGDKIPVLFSNGMGGGSGTKPTLKVKKVDKFDPSIVLGGATFTLQDVSETHESLGLQPVSMGTDENGIAEFSRLYFNTDYKLKETNAPEGYKPVEDKPEFYKDIILKKENLIQNTLTIEQENIPKLGWIELKKVSSVNKDHPIEGATIVVSTDKEGKNVVWQYTDITADDGEPKEAIQQTDENGNVKFEGLRCGTYYLVETKAPDGYAVSNEAIKFTISNDIVYLEKKYTVDNKGTVEGNSASPIMEDEPIGSLKVKKVDSEDETITLSDAKIALYGNEADAKADKHRLTEIKTTNANGIATFDNLKAGDYWVREIKAPGHYLMSTDVENRIAKVTLRVVTDKTNSEYDKVVQDDIPVLKNQPVGSFTLTKQDIYNKAPVSDAKITITATPSNAAFETIIAATDTNGRAVIKDLPFGTYTWEETELPDGYTYCDGYNGTQNTGQPKGTFTIGRDNFETGVSETAYNRPVLVNYSFKKVDNDNQGIAGVQFKLQTAGGKDITNAEYSKPVGIFTSDSAGDVKIGFLRPGKYKCVEIKGVANHEQTAEVTFTIEPTDVNGNSWDGQTKNEEIAVINWKTGQHRIEKKDAVTGELITSSKTKIRVWAVDDEGKEWNNKDERYYGEELFVSSGIFDLNLKVGTYKYKEVTAPINYALDSAEYSFEIKYADTINDTTTSILSNKPLGSISVTKKEQGESGIALEGAEIGLYSDAECSTLVKLTADNSTSTDLSNPRKTDKNGKVNFDGLILDKTVTKYWLKETAAPTGYLLNETPVECSFDGLAAGTVLSKEIEDKPVMTTLQVTKTDGLTPANPVAGAVIGLYDGSGDSTGEEAIMQATTNVNGIATFENVRYGTYYAQEITPPEHYLIDPDPTEMITINSVDQNGDEILFTKTLVDVPTGSFTLTKISSVNPEEKLEGAKIALTRTDIFPNQVIEPKTTGTDGTVKFEQLLYGTYKWEEIETPDGYIKGKVSTGTFTIASLGQDETVTLENRPQPTFNYQIKKTGTKADGLDGRLLDGAEFGVYTKVGDVLVGTIQKTADGVADFKGLQCGITYYYKELTPPVGFRLDNAEYEFKVEDNGSDEVRIIQETAVNELVRGSFQLKKIGSKLEKDPIPGVTFEVEYKGRGEAGADNPTPDKTIWQEKTNADGIVMFENLPAGEYVCREIETLPEYHLDKDWKYSFTISSDGELAEYVDAQGNKEYANYGPYTGSLELTKTDLDTSEPLEGAVVGVFLASNGTKAAEGTTDKEGHVTIAPLYEGDYYYQEIQAPYGYALDDTKHPFSIHPDSESVSEIFTNTKLITGIFEVHKTGEDGKPLAGAKIGLYKNPGNILIESQTTGEDGKAIFKNLNKEEQDHYYYRELQAPSGYVLDEEEYPFDFHISEEGQTVIEELTNSLMRGSFELLKLDSANQAPLAGAEITLYQENGTELEKKQTDQNGKALFEGLLLGNYYYVETAAPRGYVQDSLQHSITISEHGQTVKESLENTKAYVPDDSDDSDNSSHTGGSNKPGGNTGTPPTVEAGPGIPKPEEVPSEPATPLPPQEENRQPIVPDSDGSTTITVPETPPGTMIKITDTEDDEVFRGRSDESRQVHVVLDPGDYTVFAIDDEGVPLVSMPITIEDAAVPLAAADVGDHSLPAPLLAAIMLAALAGAGILIVVQKSTGKKKKEEE